MIINKTKSLTWVRYKNHAILLLLQWLISRCICPKSTFEETAEVGCPLATAVPQNDCRTRFWETLFSCECIHILGKKTLGLGNGRYGRVSISALFHCQTWGKDGCATLFLGRKFGVFTTLETNICRIHHVCKIFLLYLYSSLGGGFICNCLISIYKDTNNISLPQLLSIISYTELTLI